MSIIDQLILNEVVKDGPALVRSVVAAFGGGPDGAAKVRAILDAEYAATDATIDVLEADRIARETLP